MITQILSSLDLNEEEIKIYLALLELGQSTAGNLAKRLGLARATLYGYLDKLYEKGLIVQSQNTNVKTFTAELPEKINLLFQQKIEDVQNKQLQYREIMPDLRKNQASKLLSPRFQLYEGEAGVKHVLKDMLLYSNLETQAFWPIKAMVEILSPDFFRYHNKERIKNNLYTRAIWPQGQLINPSEYPYLGVGEKFRREIRVAPNEIDFTMGYWIYGDKVACISSRKESFGFIIESTEYAEMLRTQFEMLWNLSKPLTVDESTTRSFIEELERYNP